MMILTCASHTTFAGLVFDFKGTFQLLPWSRAISMYFSRIGLVASAPSNVMDAVLAVPLVRVCKTDGAQSSISTGSGVTGLRQHGHTKGGRRFFLMSGMSSRGSTWARTHCST